MESLFNLQDGHVHNAEVGAVDAQSVYVRVKCIPETRQAANPYQTWVLLGITGVVKAGGCDCIAGYGVFHQVYAMCNIV